MKDSLENRKITPYLVLGILGAVLLSCSDITMIYGDVTALGELPWLTLGAAGISAKRNAFALMLSFPAVILYALGLFKLKLIINDERERERCSIINLIGMTPWLALHLFYVIILFLFSFMHEIGESELAYTCCEALFGQFSFIVITADILMIMPFIYLSFLIFKNKTYLSKWVFLNNPILIFVILKVLLGFLPYGPLNLALLNALMSESMIIYFLAFIMFLRKTEK